MDGAKTFFLRRLTKEVKTVVGAVKERHRANELAYIVLSFPSLKLRS